jgi:hypothetical protein
MEESQNSVTIADWKPLRDEKGYFLPGQGGKPKGSRHFGTLLREAVQNITDGNGTTIDKQILLTLINKAKAGDIRAIEIILDRTDGKVAQEIELSTTQNIDNLTPEQRAKLDKILNVAE